MKRFMFRAQIKKESINDINSLSMLCKDDIAKLIEERVLMTASLYRWENQLFLYYECIDKDIAPDFFLGGIRGLLEEWPALGGKEKWMSMIEIFHFDVPIDEAQWKRRLPVEDRAAKLARIKPEMLSSYIYYHYMLQEGKRDMGNKYCVIGLHENFILHYEEHPLDIVKPSFTGKLEDFKLKMENWEDMMYPHFIQWEDEEEESLRKLKPLISM